MSRIIYAEELIENFQKKYPQYSINDIKVLCRAQFKMAKNTIELGDLEEIRLQYLFVLRVSPQKVMKQLKFMSYYIPGETMNAKKHKFYLDMMLRYIKNHNNKFVKYYGKIKEYTGLTIREINSRTYPNYGYISNT